MQRSTRDNARVTFVGHATTLVEMSGTRILTDPVFRRRFRLLSRRFALSPESIDLGRLDAVVLSHMHFDHMDYPSLRMIPQHTPIIAPHGAPRYLHRRIGHEIIEMKVGDSLRVGGIEILATPAQHDSGFYWPMWHPKTVLSYVMRGSQTLFFVGDTALFDMRDLGKSHAIDLALLPVWGFGPYLRGDHMTPAEAAEALSMLAPRVAVPIHWGTLHPVGPWWRNMAFLNRPPYRFALEASRRAPDTEVRVLKPGDCTVVDRARSRATVEDLIINPAEIQPALV